MYSLKNRTCGRVLYLRIHSCHFYSACALDVNMCQYVFTASCRTRTVPGLPFGHTYIPDSVIQLDNATPPISVDRSNTGNTRLPGQSMAASMQATMTTPMPIHAIIGFILPTRDDVSGKWAHLVCQLFIFLPSHCVVRP